MLCESDDPVAVAGGEDRVGSLSGQKRLAADNAGSDSYYHHYYMTWSIFGTNSHDFDFTHWSWCAGYEVKWRKREIDTYYLREGRMFFVNRDQAVRQLQDWHQLNYARAACLDGGLAWIIPLADHIVGLGKTSFAAHYVHKCQEQWHDIAQRTPVQKAICESHTIIVRLSPGQLARSGVDWNTVITARLKETIGNLSEITPETLMAKDYASPIQLLNDVVSFNGSVFLVLDEIGQAFEEPGLHDFERRNLFLRFCDDILDPWLNNSKIFFLLTGRASFLSYVGRRPAVVPGATSKHEYRRLSLHLLRPRVIAQILKNTYVSRGMPVSLQSYFNIAENVEAGDDRPSLDTTARHLFEQTNGHPRTLCEALLSCLESKNIMTYTQEPIQIRWDDWYLHYCQYKTHLDALFEAMQDERIRDLTLTVVDKGKKQISLENIASNACLAAEGDFSSSKLFAPKLIWDFWTLCRYNFRGYMQALAKIEPGDDIPIQYADCWESMLIRRFQEMFRDETTPARSSPAFLATPKFGRCEFRLFSEAARLFPKITSQEQRTKPATLDDETAVPEAWKILLAQVDAYDFMCFRPRPMSASPDAFAVAKAKLDGGVVRLSVMIAAKNFKPTTYFDDNAYQDELGKANRMFEGSCQDSRLNVLVIAATNYRNNIQARFEGKKFFAEQNALYSHLHEIIFLDLTTAANRALFFGMDSNDALTSTIERVIFKVQK